MDPPSPPPSAGGAAEDDDPPFPLLPSSCLEIRLFYVRISPSSPDSTPSSLTLSHLRREIGVPLQINGSRLPPSLPTSLPLRLSTPHPPDATYVSTDSVRVAGPLEFEVRHDLDLVLCGSLDRVDPPWGSGSWSIDCHAAAGAASVFGQPREVEVYVAGCCGGAPIILTRTVQVGGRKKARQGMLDAIPEDEESGDGTGVGGRDGVYCRRQMQLVADGESDEDETKLHASSGFYPEGAYYDEDGQLSWFNAGVRVGVGIGLGMCIGVGIGVGLLMRSYQATRNTFRRRFF